MQENIVLQVSFFHEFKADFLFFWNLYGLCFDLETIVVRS